MRELVARYLSHSISRRTFLKGLTASGISLTAARSILDSLVPAAHAQTVEAVKIVEGSGALCFAEQLIASGVKYVFGNSASEDAQFYEALVDRPQIKYILTPHEGPGAAMAAGYVKASGEPTIVMPGGGGTQNLARAAGERRAKELILSGRQFTAAEGMDWGIFNRACEAGSALNEALETAKAIAENAPLSVRQAKKSIRYGLQTDLLTGYRFEIEAYNRLVDTEDRREGVRAFNEKRKPVFRGK